MQIVKTDHLGTYGVCAACGSPVSHYTANAALIARRPAAAGEDYWAACDNELCPNHDGEGFLQSVPDWEVPVGSQQ